MIIPAILTDDTEELSRQLKTIATFSPWVHVDIMDGQFVETASVPVESIPNSDRSKHLEIHLMVNQPAAYLESCRSANASRVILHHEALTEPRGVLESIDQKHFPFDIGVALNPETPPEIAKHYDRLAESIMLMGVHPGKQGNPYVKETPTRVETLKSVTKLPIAVDGGINADTLPGLKALGVERFVVGSAILNQEHPEEAYRILTASLSV